MFHADHFPRPFSLPRPQAPPLLRAGAAIAAPVIESALGLSLLNHLYGRAGEGDFIDRALALLEITVERDAADGEVVPRDRPLIVCANHPTGALDGLAVMHVIRRARADVKLLANHLLQRIPEMRPWMIAVDPYGAGQRANASALLRARRWLERGGVLIVFPAGEISSRRRGDRFLDAPWQPGLLRLAAWTGAGIVPAFVSGEVSTLLHLAGGIDWRVKTALLPRGLLSQRGSTIRVAVGNPVSAERLARLPDDEARLAYLRARTYGLDAGQPKPGRLQWRRRLQGPEPIAPAVPTALLAEDVATLPKGTRVHTSGPYDVYCAPAVSLPHVLPEIGRLREIAFRAAGEGTGKARDLDRFDADYHHLFVWHRDRQEIAGAYRLGFTDRLLATRGLRGLYTRTLFHFGRPLLDEIGPAIELGRSFVREEYQRDSNALLMLWKGIGQVVAHAPKYRCLFGPVSISAEYRSVTRDLLARFLSSHSFTSELARLVRPKRPLLPESEAASLVRTTVAARLEDVEALVKEIEPGRRLPILLKQYLRLNGRLLGFSEDPSFGNVLDGLILVDLLDVKPALLQRYLGGDGAAALLAYHARQPVRALDAVPAEA